MAYVLLVVVIVVASILALMWALQRYLIYLPSTGPVPPAAELIEGARDVTLKTSDGVDLAAWFVRPRAPATGYTVLVANGNAGDRSVGSPLPEALAR